VRAESSGTLRLRVRGAAAAGGAAPSYAVVPSAFSVAKSRLVGDGAAAATAGKNAVFTVLARDAFSNPLSSPFSPAITVVAERTLTNGTIQSLAVTSTDIGGSGGAIRVAYAAPDALAPYSVIITVQVGGVATLLTSTAAVAILAGPLDASASAVLTAAGVPLAASSSGAGDGSTAVGAGVAGEALTLTVALRDSAGRALDASGAGPAPPVLFSSAGASLDVVAGVPVGAAGAYTVTFTSTVAGSQALSASIGGAALGAGSFAMRVFPGAADASKAIVSGPGVVSTTGGAIYITAGQVGRVTIASRDRFGNARSGGGFFDTFAYAVGSGPSADAVGLCTLNQADP
jgi:hypothetical protein